MTRYLILALFLISGATRAIEASSLPPTLGVIAGSSDLIVVGALGPAKEIRRERMVSPQELVTYIAPILVDTVLWDAPGGRSDGQIVLEWYESVFQDTTLSGVAAAQGCIGRRAIWIPNLLPEGRYDVGPQHYFCLTDSTAIMGTAGWVRYWEPDGPNHPAVRALYDCLRGAIADLR